MSIRKEFAILFSVLFLPGLLGQFGTNPANQFESILYNLQILAVAVPQVWLVAWFAELHTPGVQQRMGFRPLRPSDGPGALLVAVSLFLVSAGVSALLGLAAGVESQSAAGWSFSRPEILPLVVLSSVAVGYREEIFYRSYLFTRATELRVPPAATIVGSSLLFAVGHLYQGIAGFVVTALLGAVLGLFYHRSQSLHAVAIGHGLYNAAVLVLSGVGPAAG